MKVQHEAQHLINLDDKSNKLTNFDKHMTDIVILRFIGQMPVHAVADAVDISKQTVKRDWAKASGWLYKEMHGA